MSVKERIEAFNEENRPFYIVDHDAGKFSLCLPLDFLHEEYEDFGQAAFDAYAIEIGEPPVDSRGFHTHGNGYEWESAFHQTFADDPNIDKILFDCEAGGFFCYATTYPCWKNTARSSEKSVWTPKNLLPLCPKASSIWSNGLQNKKS